MMIDQKERIELPRRLFALAGRKLECATGMAGAGEAPNLPPERSMTLAGDLHTCGQDLMAIADAIACLVCETPEQ